MRSLRNMIAAAHERAGSRQTTRPPGCKKPNHRSLTTSALRGQRLVDVDLDLLGLGLGLLLELELQHAVFVLGIDILRFNCRR